MLSETRLALLTLSLTPGLAGNALLQAIRALREPGLVLRASAAELQYRLPVTPDQAAAVVRTRDTERAAEVMRRCELLEVELLFLGQAGYPALLAETATPPPVLYVRGHSAALAGASPLAALVGTRNGTTAGLAFAFTLAAELAAAGATVVSGLALGTDGQVHRGALHAAGCTVAVIASGIDQVTPRTHTTLGRRIERDGAIISEYPPGVPAAAWHFPVRNRIIAGLSSVTAVLEAGERSGALHTARAALEEGRTVFALPGRPGDPHVKGSLALLVAGATPLTHVDDILAELRLERATDLLATLPDDLRDMVLLLATLGPVTLDELNSRSTLGIPELLATVNRLKLRGVLVEDELGVLTLLGSVPDPP
jgi:DNA processing protein